jgi:hypothetical protein
VMWGRWPEQALLLPRASRDNYRRLVEDKLTTDLWLVERGTAGCASTLTASNISLYLSCT